jgi:hypothetical protein
VAVVGVGGVGCVGKVGTTADEANEAETVKAAKAVANAVVGSAKGAHAAKGWVAEATAVAEEKDTEADTVMAAAVVAAVAAAAAVGAARVRAGRAGMEARVREAEVVAEGMEAVEAQTGTMHCPAPQRSPGQ